MNTPNTPQTPDHRLDALLAQQALRAKPDFVERTLARVQKVSNENSFDTSLDDLLACQPQSATPDFTDRTLERIRTEAQTRKKAVPFTALLPWISTLAALVALAFIVTSVRNPQAVPDSLAATDGSLDEVPALIVNADTDPVAIDRSLWLARELDGAEAFLEDDDWTVIPLLVDY